jgi:diguanylate cyclase (GGDEF)-like protein
MFPSCSLTCPSWCLGLRLSQPRNVWFRRYRPSQRAHAIAGGISPFVLSMALCLLAFVQLGSNHAIALGAMALGIVSYAIRVALLLGYHLRQEGELKHLQRGLQKTIIHDELTRLLNRRGFFRNFDRAQERAMQEQSPLAVALVDIDMFKAYNDTYGHLAGDDCLAKVAGALQQEADGYGDLTVARYGGEEFVCLFEGADAEDAADTLDACRKSLRDRLLRDQTTNLPIGRISFSAGVVTIEDDSADALRIADELLYAAKRAGKDQVATITNQVASAA